jgi:4'-phosphopantetheinyl transferase
MQVASTNRIAVVGPLVDKANVNLCVANANPCMGMMSQLNNESIHVWTLMDVQNDCAELREVLSEDELQIASRFCFPHLVSSYIGIHGWMRRLLGLYLDIDPQSLKFVVNEFGKPALAGPHGNLQFNLSHSASVAVLALCKDAAIGIDIEAIRLVEDWEAVAAAHFSRSEYHALQAEPTHERNAAFLRCWTRKEALLKAMGVGLSLDPATFEVGIAKLNSGESIIFQGVDEVNSKWIMTDMQTIPGYIASLVVEGQKRKITQFEWRGENHG